MRPAPPLIAAMVGLLLAVEQPTMSAPERWTDLGQGAAPVGTLSTQSRRNQCEDRRGRGCERRRCCEGLYCRTTDRGESKCR